MSGSRRKEGEMKHAWLLGLSILGAPLFVHAQARVEVAPTTYCAQVGQFSSSRQAEIFAQVNASRWAEFSSPEAWKDAGSPLPLALAWQRDGKIVRVAIASRADMGAQAPYSDYCYRTDGTLARTRLMPQKDVECDAGHVRCEMTLRGEQFFGEDGKAWKPSSNGQQMREAEMLEALDSWEFKPESTRVSLDLTVPRAYLRVPDLPFYGLLSGIR